MSELFELKFPDASYADQIQAYREIFIKKHNSLDGTANLLNMEDPIEWIAHCEACRNADTVPEGLVQATEFLYVRKSDDALVGMIQVRHTFNEYLALYGGHIGYSVLPKERRAGIATKMLKDVLPFCKEIGLEQVLITCLKDNEGSRRTILANGGYYEGDIVCDGQMMERYWIHL